MDENEAGKKKKSEIALRGRAKQLTIPRRAPSTVIPGRKIVFITPDKTTCVECDCFPKEDPYRRPKKLNPCQQSPLTLYELAASVLDNIRLPEALSWSEDQVVNWMTEEVGLPEYRECVLDNHIDGMRLLMFEDPSKLPDVNIHNFDHIKIIVSKIRQVYGTDFVKFSRSVGLPPRKPMTHCTWFKSRTGPSWGVRKNWTRCDILRWMKIIMAEPIHLDHWDRVWYQKSDFPKVLFAKIEKPKSVIHIPRYKPQKEECKEYLVKRKFRFLTGIPEDAQLIWMEHRPGSPSVVMEDEKKTGKKVKITVPIKSRLERKRISLTGLKGKDLILARRKMPKPKFLVQQNKMS